MLSRFTTFGTGEVQVVLGANLNGKAEQQEDETKGNQCAELHTISFTKVTGEGCCDGGTAGEDALWHAHDVTNNEADGHCFTEGTTHADEDTTKDTADTVANHDVASGFPAGTANSVGGFLEHGWGHGKDITHDSAHEGQNHQGENNARCEEAHPSGSGTKEPLAQFKSKDGDVHQAKGITEEGQDVGIHDRNEDEEPPHTINDGWNGSKQVDALRNGLRNPVRRFSNKEGGNEGKGNGEDECNERAEQGAHDIGQCSEHFIVGIPLSGPDEPDAELVPSICGVHAELPEDAKYKQTDNGGAD